MFSNCFELQNKLLSVKCFLFNRHLYQVPDAMNNAGDNLVDLCKWSFDAGLRGVGGTGSSNPTIVDMARVQCPEELVDLTQIKRTDDPDTFVIMEENRPVEYQEANVDKLEPCHCSCGGQDCRFGSEVVHK